MQEGYPHLRSSVVVGDEQPDWPDGQTWQVAMHVQSNLPILGLSQTQQLTTWANTSLHLLLL